MRSSEHKHVYLFENLLDPSSQEVRWKQHIIRSGHAIHEACAGDVDGDGDPDIVIKPWNRKSQWKDVVYLENQQVSRPR